MPGFAYFILIFIRYFLFVLEVAMFVRAVLSWFPGGEDSVLERFLRIITEPFILPIRFIFDKFGWGSDLPIDLPFFVTLILISIVSAFMM